jgi:hypothetical protein
VDPGDVPPDVGTARHLRRHVLFAHHSGRRVERRRNRELGVDGPVAREPAEQFHRPLHRGLLIGVVRQGDLADARLPGASRLSAEETAMLDKASTPIIDDYPYGDLGVSQRDRELPAPRPHAAW